MEEILKKLLESDLLSEDSKAEITEMFTTSVESMKENLRKEVEVETRSQLIEEWTTQRDALVEAVDEKVTEMLADEMKELREDIERFRDLEVEYTEKLVTEKHALADQLASELDGLVEKLDVFLEYRVNEEMTELKEDLAVVRENEFGREIFEAFNHVFNKSFVDEESIQAQLRVSEDKLADANNKLVEAEAERQIAVRAKKLDEALSSLSGVKREQMALILENVETSKLTEAYNMFIGRILKEAKVEAKPAAVAKPAKDSVLAEDKAEDVKPAAVAKTTVVTGEEVRKPSKPARVSEAKKQSESAALNEMRKLAGITV